jgi:hypothetical protein
MNCTVQSSLSLLPRLEIRNRDAVLRDRRIGRGTTPVTARSTSVGGGAPRGGGARGPVAERRAGGPLLDRRLAVQHEEDGRRVGPGAGVLLHAQEPDLRAGERLGPGVPAAQRRVHDVRRRPAPPLLPHLQQPAAGTVNTRWPMLVDSGDGAGRYSRSSADCCCCHLLQRIRWCSFDR